MGCSALWHYRRVGLLVKIHIYQVYQSRTARHKILLVLLLHGFHSACMVVHVHKDHMFAFRHSVLTAQLKNILVAKFIKEFQKAQASLFSRMGEKI